MVRSGQHITVVGGAGFVGAATCRVLVASGLSVTVVDRTAPADPSVPWISCDVLEDDLPPLPPGHVVLALGVSDPRAPRLWTLPVGNAVATARVLPHLRDRDVTLLSSVEVYGVAPGVLGEDTPPELPGLDLLDDWCQQVSTWALTPCPEWRAAPLGQALVELDPSGRWVYGLSKLAQELLVRQAVPEGRLTVLRLANVVGAAQERVVTRLVRRALTGLPLQVTEGVQRSFLPDDTVGRLLVGAIPPGTYNVGAAPVALRTVADLVLEATGARSEIVALPAPSSDASGLVGAGALEAAGHRVQPLWDYLPRLVEEIAAGSNSVLGEALPVVIPPRPQRPDLIVRRQQAALRSGLVKHGNRWTCELHEALAQALALTDDHVTLATTSGTAALRLALAATVGPASAGEVAVLPSYTFAATAEVLLQLGYRLRYADVDPSTWTLDAARLPDLLSAGDVRVVVAVDTFGQPCDYAGLREVCDTWGVALVADSAASLGSQYNHRPVAGLADAHSYSMSFAKTISSGGAGGAVALPAVAAERLHADPHGWTRSELMTELHAVVALDQLAVLQRLVAAREQVAEVYRSAVSSMPGLHFQRSRPGDRHSYVHTVIRTPARELVQDRLLREGIGTKPYFPALHRTSHPIANSRHPLPMTEHLHREALALPTSSEMTEGQAEAVVAALQRALREETVTAGSQAGMAADQ